MDTALHSAVSGMRAAAKRLEVSAGNVANARSEGFVPGQVAQSAQEPAGTRADAVAVEPPSVPVYQTQQAAADQGVVQRPNVSLETETAAQTIARREFAANLRALEAVDRTQKSLLDILA